MVKKSLDLGYDLYDVLRAASYNPAMHYKIPAGFLREGDSADFIQVNNLKDLTIQATYIQGTCVYDGEKCTLPLQKPIHHIDHILNPAIFLPSYLCVLCLKTKDVRHLYRT